MEHTVFVEEEVAGLEVSVDDIGGMHVKDPSEDLINEILYVVV